MAIAVPLRLDFGPPTVGVWCPTCALPSAVTVAVYWLRSTGVKRLGTTTACRGCGLLRQER